jgi:hypothetical protein
MSSQIQKVLQAMPPSLHMHKTHGIKGGQRQCIELKHKEAWALKEREELATIIKRAS